MSQPGQVSHGLPPREPTLELARRIADLDRSVRERVSSITQSIQALTAALNTGNYVQWLGEDTRFASGSVVASNVAVNVGTLTLPLVAGSLYRATWIGNLVPNTAGQYMNVDLKHAVGAGTGGTFFQRTFWDCRAVGRIVSATVVGEFVAPTTQTENIVAVLTPQGGTGGTYSDGTTGAPSSSFWVDQI